MQARGQAPMHIPKKQKGFVRISRWFLTVSLLTGAVRFAGAVEPEPPLYLSLAQAMDMALENNLQAILAAERIHQAKGEKSISLAALLPNLAGSLSQQSYTTNLAALGIPITRFPGISPFVGPNNRFDARLQLVQSVFNLASIWRYRAGKHGVDLATEQEHLVGQQVIAAAILGYISLLEAEQAVQTAQSNAQLAQRLLDLAVSQMDKGVATGLDVARAQTRVSNQQVQLSQAETARDTARINLLRIIGAPLSQSLVPADSMAFDPRPHPGPDEAIRQALSDRFEIRVAELQIRLAQTLRKAASADQLPSVSIFADYGSSGINPDEINLPTRTFGIQVDIPLFNGGRTRGQITVAKSRECQAQMKLADLRLDIERDVRVALENLVTRESQVKAADQTVALAERELELSQDRFANGVVDNIEVVNAQTALENARQILVSSTAQFNVARLNLAVAVGHAEKFRF
jgi:outer membrane protein